MLQPRHHGSPVHEKPHTDHIYIDRTRHCLLIALAIASSSHSPLPPHRTRHCLLIALAIASSSHSPLPPHRTRHCLLIALAIASSSHSPLPPHRTRHCLTFAESSGLTVGWYVYISQLLTRRRDASAYFTWERIIQHRCRRVHALWVQVPPCSHQLRCQRVKRVIDLIARDVKNISLIPATIALEKEIKGVKRDSHTFGGSSPSSQSQAGG